MKSFLSRRPSPALVISLIALFISLSGVSYGVASFIDSREIKNNQVRSADLRNNDVRTRDLRNNEVRGIDIRNSTVRGADVGLQQLTGDDINESRLGKVERGGGGYGDHGDDRGFCPERPDDRSGSPRPRRHARHARDPRSADRRPALLRRHGRHGAWITVASSPTTPPPSAVRAMPISTRRIPPQPVIPRARPCRLSPSGFAAALVAAAANGQALSGSLSVLADEDAATCGAQGTSS